MKKSLLIRLIKLSNPFFIMGGIVQYMLGVGMARYFGSTINWCLFFQGLVWIIFLQTACYYLFVYFDSHIDKRNEAQTFQIGGSGSLREENGQLPYHSVALATGVALCIVALFTIMIIRAERITPGIFIIMGLILFGGFFYSVPPIKFAYTGYGEFTIGVLIGNLVPAFGYLLQSQKLNRFFVITTLPLSLLVIAMIIAISFPGYANDMKYGKQNLLIRLGWENGMILHNIFILMAYTLIGLAGVIGLPSAISLPALLPLPLGLLQIWNMRQIAIGQKPNWRALTLNAAVLFGTTSYLLTYGFWAR